MLAERAPRLYGALRKAADAAIRFRSRERREAFGELNPDRTIYIIRFRREKLGLMALYLNVLLRIKEASDRGMVPVVDLQNYPNTYLEQDLLHRVNSREHYFRHPSRFSLEEAYRSANVVLSDMETPVLGSPRSFYQSCLCGPRAGEYLSVARDRMGFADEFAEYFEGQLRNVFAPRSSGRVLGIVSRGTDLVGFEGHSVQPTLNELVSAARAPIKTYDISAVYVASDSDSALESIREELGRDVVFSFDQRRFDC